MSSVSLLYRIMGALLKEMIGRHSFRLSLACCCSSCRVRRQLQSTIEPCWCSSHACQVVPVADLLSANHTVFSEESGEIALSVLAHSQPVNVRADLKVTRAYWLLTRQRYLALRSGEDLPRVKKSRVVGIILSICFFPCLISWLWPGSLPPHGPVFQLVQK